MKIFRFIFSKAFYLNLFLIGVTLLILIIVSLRLLKNYTHHNEYLTVPDFKGLSIDEVKQVCNNKHLRFEIKDSTYKPGVPFFTVVEQDPSAPNRVKLNRTIYLTISTDKPPMVEMPDIYEKSLQNAIKKLQNIGLKVGELEYIPHYANNLVLEVKLNGKQIYHGDEIKKESVVDLVLGDGLTGEKQPVPSLIGINYEELMFVLPASGFNIGATLFEAPFDPSHNDSTKAIIFKQRPLHNPEKAYALGTAIDVWLTTEEHFKSLNLPSNRMLVDSLKQKEKELKELQELQNE